MQLIIGRLVTDGTFRRRVERGGSAYLSGLRVLGVELTRAEIAALVGLDPGVWTRVAELIPLSSNRRAMPENVSHGRHLTLTARQRRVLRGVSDGLRNKDIAGQLGLSEGGVKAVIQQLFRKFLVRRRTQLVRLALNGPSWLAAEVPVAATRASATEADRAEVAHVS